MTLTVMAPAFPPSASATAVILDAVTIVAEPVVTLVPAAPPGARPTGAPTNASTTPEADAVAFVPSPDAAPMPMRIDFAVAEYSIGVTVVPARTVSDPLLRVTPSRT